MSDEFRRSILQTINKAYRTGRAEGSRVSMTVGKLTIAYKEKLTIKSPTKTVIDLPSFVYNTVIDLKRQSLKDHVPATGWMTVTDGIKLIGICEETGRVVTFLATWACRKGQRFPYRYKNGVYYLENFYPGDTHMPVGWYGGMIGDWLLQEGEKCFEYLDPDSIDKKNLEHKWESTGSYIYPEEQTWSRTDDKFEKIIIAYVEDKVYKERSIEEPANLIAEIDISAYLNDSAATGTISGEGWKSGTYHISNPVVIRMVHVGNFAILQVLREKTTYIRNVDDGSPCADDLYAQGENAEAYNSITLFNLIIIDIVEGTVNELDFITRSTWFDLPPVTISGGYTDIQIDKETGELLYIKSDTSPSTGSVSVSYYECDGYICLINNDPDEDEPSYDVSSSATTRKSGYTLYRAKLDTSTLNFTGVTTVHSEASSRSSIAGVSVSGGGLRSMTFTQQPESFDIFLRMHAVGYKMAKKDWEYTPTNGDPERVERWQRDLVCIGLMEFTTVSGTVLFSAPTTELGVYSTCSWRQGLDDDDEPFEDAYEIEHLDDAVVFNACAEIARMYGLRCHWPDLEANAGLAESWPSGAGERDDYPTKNYDTVMIETRWAQAWLGLSTLQSKKTQMVVNQLDQYIYPVPRYSVNGSLGLRFDPDNFMAFSAAASPDGILFCWSGACWMARARLRCDSEADFNSYDCQHLFPGSLESGIWLSDFKARENSIKNMIWFAEQEGIPHATDYFAVDTAAGGWHYSLNVHEIFKHCSILQLSDQFGIWFMNMQYHKFWFNPSNNDVNPIVHRRVTVAGFIISHDSYIVAQDAEGNPELVCFWMNLRQHWEESPDTGLGYANISNKVRVKEFGELSVNGLYTP